MDVGGPMFRSRSGNAQYGARRPIFSSNLNHGSQKTGSLHLKSCNVSFDIPRKPAP
jgi:hypothetical protein